MTALTSAITSHNLDGIELAAQKHPQQIDEPENGLDDQSKIELDEKLKILSKKNTIIFTSHNSNSLSIYKKTTKELIL